MDETEKEALIAPTEKLERRLMLHDSSCGLCQLKSSAQLQGRFVEQLYGSGMVDEMEKEALIAPIERLERRLMRRGALGWRSPRVDEVRGCMSLSTVSPSCIADRAAGGQSCGRLHPCCAQLAGGGSPQETQREVI